MTKRYALPPRFYEDHLSRDLPSGTLVHFTKSKATVDLDREGYDDLLDDARHYASDQGWDDGLAGLRASARATVRTLEASPFEEQS